jgi:hypothetical protein
MLKKAFAEKIKTNKKSPRLKAAFLTVIFVLSTITALPILQTTEVGAVKKASGMTFLQQIESYLYYKAIASCMKHAELRDRDNWNWSGDTVQKIDNEHVATYEWFGSGLTSNDQEVTIGPYMIGMTGVNDEGQIKCGKDPNLIAGALKLWDLKPAAVLCNSNFHRFELSDNQSITDCINSTKDLRRVNDDRDASAAAFTKYIKKVIYGGQEPKLTAPQSYIYLRHTLNQSCIPGIDKTKPSNQPPDANLGYGGVKWVDETKNKVLTGSYLGDIAPGDNIRFGINGSFDNEEKTCRQIVQDMNSFAQAYLTWRKTNRDEPTTPAAPKTGDDTEENENSCGAQVTALGWIVCPIISGLAKLNDAMWGIIDGLLKVNPLGSPLAEDGSNSNNNLYKAWGTIRSIANIVFVLFFLVIIFSQLTGIGITNYGVKKLLPKVIICAILVNISYIIMQLAVDLANIIGASLYDVIVGLANDMGPPLSWQTFFNEMEIGIVLAGGAATVALAAIAAPEILFWVVLPFIAMAALGLLVAVLTLIFRQAVIPMLAILAPLAFVAYLLPNTEKWFKQWRNLLLSMLMMYPLAALIFAGAQFAAAAISSGGGFWNSLIGLIVMAMPLFSLPFIARQGGPLLSRVNGALTGLANRARQPITNFSRNQREHATSDFLANKPSNTRLGRLVQGNRVLSTPRRMARQAAFLGHRRQQETEANKLSLQQQMQDNTTGRMGDSVMPSNRDQRRQGGMGQVAGYGGAQARDNLAFMQKRGKVQDLAAEHRQDAHPTGQMLNEAIVRGGEQHKLDEHDTMHRVSEDTRPGGGRDLLRRVNAAQRQAGIDTKNIDTEVERDPTYLDLRMRSGAAESENKTAKQQTEAILKHATSAAGGGAGTISAGVDPGVIASLQQSAHDAEQADISIKTSDNLISEELLNAPDLQDARVLQAASEDKKADAAKRVETIISQAKMGTAATPDISMAAVTEAQGASHNLERATLQADKASEQLAAMHENDPSLKGARVSAAAAKKAHEAATSQTTQLVTEATTQAAGAPGSVLAGLDAADRASLRTSQMAANVAASATTQAQREGTREYTEAILDQSTGVAAAAAGIGGNAAKTRVQAAATAAQSKQRQEEVSAATTLFADQGYQSGSNPDEPPGELMRVIRDEKLKDGSDATEEEVEAAMQLVFNTGSADAISGMYNVIASLPDGQVGSGAHRKKLKLEQALSRIGAAGKRPKSLRGGILGKLSAGDIDTSLTSKLVGMDARNDTGASIPITPFQSIAFEILDKGKLAAESFAETDQEELRIWADMLSSDPSVSGRIPDVIGKFKLDQAQALYNNMHKALTDPLINKDIKPEQITQINRLMESIASYPGPYTT